MLKKIIKSINENPIKSVVIFIILITCLSVVAFLTGKIYGLIASMIAGGGIAGAYGLAKQKNDEIIKRMEVREKEHEKNRDHGADYTIDDDPITSSARDKEKH